MMKKEDVVKLGSLKIKLNEKEWTVSFKVSDKIEKSSGRTDFEYKEIVIELAQKLIDSLNEKYREIPKDALMHVIRYELIKAVLYSTGNYEHSEEVLWGVSENVVDWFAVNLDVIKINAIKIYEKFEAEISKFFEIKKSKEVA